MNDIEFIAYAESVCFEKPWTAGEIRAAAEDGFAVTVVIPGTGYALGRLLCDEAELYRIAVLPEKRRAGAGAGLLGRFVDECLSRGAERVFLEVRSRNVPAVTLYEHSGFTLIAKRKNYYGDDDALIYKRDIR
ncbi:MAG: GNAT family N-acetyltransferase [Ruminiclostridium sp.]|nr:GNAT family N-acetyltransferase [Ruminiclostridium sp.]